MVPDPETLVTEAQRRLSDRVQHRLEEAGAGFAKELLGYSVEAVFVYRLQVREPHRLVAEVSVGPDMFGFLANGADLHLEVQDARGDFEKWIELCDETIHALLSHDLRIRVRRTLWGHRRGVVWVPLGEGGWNGELIAWLGVGHEMRFTNWLGIGGSDMKEGGLRQ